jgi:hypothetical protein
MVRKIALMFLKYIFHVALRITNKLDWILDADSLTLKCDCQFAATALRAEHTGAANTPRR